jgi:hypothetical protein
MVRHNAVHEQRADSKLPFSLVALAAFTASSPWLNPAGYNFDKIERAIGEKLMARFFVW